MKILTQTKCIVGNIKFWILAWFMLVSLYLMSLHNQFHLEDWDRAVYVIQLMADSLIGFFGYQAFKKSKNLVSRRFYQLMFASLIPGLFTNEIYNLLINVIGIISITKSVNIFWVGTYSLFLLIQISCWSYLLFSNRNEKSKKSKSWVAKLPYIQSAIVVLLSLLSIAVFRSDMLNKLGFYEVVNSLLEVVLFNLISISLSRSKNKAIIYLEVGFLLLIAFNLAHRFSYITGSHFKAFDVVWLVCLIVIIYGLYFAQKNSQDKIDLIESNSILVYTSSIFVIFATVILVALFGIGLFISYIQADSLSIFNAFANNIPSVLVFSYTFSILAGKIVSGYLSAPLDQIAKKVDLISNNKLNSSQAINNKSSVHEVKKLDGFITKTLVELHQANQVKSDFLMNMSHDFRTPASGIYHLSRSVHKRIQDDHLKGLQKLVMDSSEQLMNLLEDVLDYSRLDSDKYNFTVSEIHVSSLVDDIVLLVSAKSNEKNLAIHKYISRSELTYSGDRLVLHRILLNLITNAIKFTNDGYISISISESLIENDQWLILKIKDTGMGIDEKYHSAIFEPFYRVASTETSKHAGVGLGLSNIENMLKKIGGKISIESAIGNGSIFTVSMPFLVS